MPKNVSPISVDVKRAFSPYKQKHFFLISPLLDRFLFCLFLLWLHTHSHFSQRYEGYFSGHFNLNKGLGFSTIDLIINVIFIFKDSIRFSLNFLRSQHIRLSCIVKNQLCEFVTNGPLFLTMLFFPLVNGYDKFIVHVII